MPDDRRRLVLRGPSSLPAVVPHLVGFHPEASVVAVGLGSDRRSVRVTMRLDIPTALDRSSDLIRAMWAPCVAALASADSHEVILLLYPEASEDPWRDDDLARDLPHRDLVAEIAALLDDSGMYAVDALCVVGDRWRSYFCADLACCPPEGRTSDPDEDLRTTAEFVEQGSAPLPTRADLVASLDSRTDDDPVRLRVLEAHSTRPPVGDDAAAEVARYVADLGRWGDDPRDAAELERLAAGAFRWCGGIQLRDLLLRALSAAGRPLLLVHAKLVLAEAVRCAPPTSLAPVATVLAVCAWVSGDGATARVALDRALAADPAYSLAGLVAAALDAGIPPWTWTAMMADLTVEEILAGGRLDEDGPPPEVAAALSALAGSDLLDELDLDPDDEWAYDDDPADLDHEEDLDDEDLDDGETADDVAEDDDPPEEGDSEGDAGVAPEGSDAVIQPAPDAGTAT